MANIDDMVKQSTEKTNIISKLGEKVSGLSSIFELDRKKVYDKCEKFLKGIDWSKVSGDVKATLEGFTKSRVFEQGNLERVDNNTLSNISSLVDTLEKLVSKEITFSGEKTPLNKDYADIQKAFREYSKVVDTYGGIMYGKVIINSASMEQQSKDLGIDRNGREIDDLISAFAYMGMEIMPDGKGSYTCMEIPDTGIPYLDADGKTQYIRISKNTTESFIEGYLKNGGLSCEKEEKELANQIEILKNYKANQREGGLYAPTNADIANQEREVAKAEKALKTRQAKRITKKGLYTYFVEKELIAKIPKRSQNSELIKTAREKFSIDSPEEQAFAIKHNPNAIKDDMALYASHEIMKTDLQILEEFEVDSSFVDGASSNFATGIRNSNRLENILEDIEGTKVTAGKLASENGQAMSNILRKYEATASKLEILSASYKGSPREGELQDEAKKCREIVKNIQGFSNAVLRIDTDIRFNGTIQDFPEILASIDSGVKLIPMLIDAVTFDSGKITVTKDLMDANGKVWLSKDQIETYIEAGMLETSQTNSATKEAQENETQENETQENVVQEKVAEHEQVQANEEESLPDTLSASLDCQVGEGLRFADVFLKDTMYGLAIDLIDSGNNVFADIYDEFKKHDVNAQEFVDGLADKVDFSNGFDGMVDKDVMISVFDYCKSRDLEKEKDPKSELSIEDNCVGFASARNNANACYHYIDMVSKALFENEEERRKFESADDNARKKIFDETLSKLNKDGAFNDVPTGDKLSIARERWANHFELGALQGLFDSTRKIGTKEANDLAKTLLEIGNKKANSQKAINKKLKANGEHVLDLEDVDAKTQDQESENDEQAQGEESEDAKLVKFGDVFPRSTPSSKIAKMLQPYNIKVGKKFLDQVIDAFKDVMIKSPWDSQSSANNKGENAEAGVEPKETATTKQSESPVEKNQEETVAEKQEEAVKTNPEEVKPKEVDNDSQIQFNDSQEETQPREKSIFEGYSQDRIRARVAMVSVGMGVSSIVEQVGVEKENADVVKKAMDYMTLYDSPQPIISININGRTSQLILADAMQYIFLNEFASGNKSAKEVEGSIDAIASQLGDNKALVDMVNSMKPLMGAITPAEVVNLVRMTAKIQVPQPGEPMSIDLGSNLSLEDIAKFQQAKSLDELKDMVANTKNLYNQHLVNQIMETEQLNKSSKFKQAKAYIDEQEMKID